MFYFSNFEKLKNYENKIKNNSLYFTFKKRLIHKNIKKVNFFKFYKKINYYSITKEYSNLLLEI